MKYSLAARIRLGLVASFVAGCGSEGSASRGEETRHCYPNQT